MIIGIDVDETVVEVMPHWLRYLNAVCGTQKTMEDCQFDYNLGIHFPRLKELNIDPMSFWDGEYLYDVMEPRNGCVEAMQKLVEDGHKIIFISHTRRDHFQSKVKFIKRWFPFVKLGDLSSGHGFVATHEKGVMSNLDVMIDDRRKYLPLFADDVLKIQFNTPYQQDFTGDICLDLVSNSWEEIGNFLEDIS